MSHDVPQRYEMKYRLPPEAVGPIRRAIQGRCAPDEAGRGGRYTISSLYLDSLDRRFYQESQERQARRYKLRVRRYTHGPYFLEIKRKLEDVIHKSRVAIPAEAWPDVLHDPRALDALSLAPKARRDAQDFINRCLLRDARPATLVRYEREAWVSRTEGYGRVTFDYQLMAGEPRGWGVLLEEPEARWRPFDHASRFGLTRSGVVLELKCLTRVPGWFRRLTRDFNLRRSGFSKYCGALRCLERPPE